MTLQLLIHVPKIVPVPMPKKECYTQRRAVKRIPSQSSSVVMSSLDETTFFDTTFLSAQIEFHCN